MSLVDCESEVVEDTGSKREIKYGKAADVRRNYSTNLSFRRCVTFRIGKKKNPFYFFLSRKLWRIPASDCYNTQDNVHLYYTVTPEVYAKSLIQKRKHIQKEITGHQGQIFRQSVPASPQYKSSGTLPTALPYTNTLSES